MSNSIKIALAGNPNSGKTTLFNALTGANQHVGNFPGVTVDQKIAQSEKMYQEAVEGKKKALKVFAVAALILAFGFFSAKVFITVEGKGVSTPMIFVSKRSREVTPLSSIRPFS